MAKARARNAVVVGRHPDEREEDALARELTRPELQAAKTIQRFTDDHDVMALVGELSRQANAIHGGNMRRAETLLTAQAHTLDELFNTLARRSYSNMVEGYGEAAERYMRLALKAQSQCRTTVEALAEIKNPRAVAFVRQANIANGPQQVNNGMPARAEDFSKPPNELSRTPHELLPDTRASQDASRIDSPLEAMGAIDRAENIARESAEREELNQARQSNA